VLFEHHKDLVAALEHLVEVKGNEVHILDGEAIRQKLIDRLIYNAVFHPNDDLKYYARWLIREIAAGLVIYPASIAPLYHAMGRGETPLFTTPAVNIRLFTYDVCRAYIRAAKKAECAAFIFEIAKSEMGYTYQNPGEYAACVLAAAIKEHYQGPLFIQGDHFQVSAKNYLADREREIDDLKSLIDEAIDAGFYNVDIDTSTLVDLSKPTEEEQQEPNFTNCAELTDYIRRRQPAGMEISVGGEIGEVGGTNSRVEEFRAFMEGFTRELRTRNDKAQGIAKMSVQTGTEHGGVPTAEGRVAEVKLDFNVLRDIGEVARREFGLGGTVQHGASTLPEEMFDRFPSHSCCEIHLATGFQNMIYDHPAFPSELKEEMYQWLDQNARAERKEGYSDEQFYYKSRKRALGPFKQRMWDLPSDVKQAMMADVEAKFSFYMEKLNVKNTAGLVRDTIQIKRVPMNPPATGLHKTAENTLSYILSDTGGE
jgi:fructose/tagatose bisphosphate aldolase